MNLPPVSIVIPAWNAAAFLGETLASVRALQYPPALLEAIVVDDGSTDDTASVARSALAGVAFDARVVRQANAGPANARNAGWRQARGAWIQFLDADDLVAPGKLMRQASSPFAADPSVACIHSPWRREVPAAGIPPGNRQRTEFQHCAPDVAGDTMAELLRTENFIPFASALASKHWLEQVGGFDDTLRFIEDVDLELRLAMAGGRFALVASAEPMFTYRYRSGSLSRTSRLEFFRGCVRNARLAERHWREVRGGVDREQGKLLLAIYEGALRVFAEANAPDFEVTLRDVQAIDPGFRPAGIKLGMLSRVMGIRNAYHLLGAMRRRGSHVD